MTRIPLAQHNPGMAKEKRNQKATRFRLGEAGCESLYFLVKGYLPGSKVTDEDGKPLPMDTLRICGSDIHEVAAYLKKWEPDFSLRSIRVVSLIVLLSGSRLD